MTIPSKKRSEELARNEILFREVNERIVEIADTSHPRDDLVVLCECGRRECLVQLDVPGPVYEWVRGHGACFVVLPEHITPEIERVLRRDPAYLIVEKFGPAGELAQRESSAD